MKSEKQFIRVELMELEDGTHDTTCEVKCHDDHHFLDMIYAALRQWEKTTH